MTAIPPQLLKSIPTLTHVVTESHSSGLTPKDSLTTEEFQAQLSQRLSTVVEDLVEQELNALRPLLRAKIQATLEQFLNEVQAPDSEPSR